ncbi:MAG: hypothetical protein FJ363_00375 [Gemmatimonadetes bacterium]|nr:hypothetical protein [Gemmatimonadota bacterium]
MRHSVVLFAVLAGSLLAGCAGRVRSGGEDPSSKSMLVRAQIADSRFTTAYDVVRALRNNWLNSRGIDSFRNRTEVQVYLDGVHLGSVQALQGLSAASIQYMQYINGADATTRWGTGHGRGVIYVGTGTPPAKP